MIVSASMEYTVGHVAGSTHEINNDLTNQHDREREKEAIGRVLRP